MWRRGWKASSILAEMDRQKREAGTDRWRPSLWQTQRQTKRPWTRMRDKGSRDAHEDRGGARMAEAYCVKDKKKVEVQNPQQITMKNGKPALQGTCPKCGGKVFRIGG